MSFDRRNPDVSGPGKHSLAASIDAASSQMPSPGKQTLTARLEGASQVIQRKASGEASATQPGEAFATATSGSRSEVPYRQKMESAFSTSFADVGAYLGGAPAQQGLTSLGARAAAHGNQIAFRESAPSESLVAHELAHVVQQRSGGGVQAKPVDVSAPGDAAEQRADAAADAVVRGEPVPDVGSAGPGIHRAPVESNGGKFDTTTYAANSAPTGAVGEGVGCHIVLEFKANDLVESTKIGMIQSVKAMKSSKAAGANDTVATGVGDPEEGQLIMGAKDKDPGREIDRAVHPGGRALPNTSPVYGVHNSAASKATKLTDGTPTTGTSQWGSHDKDPATKAFKAPVPARIDDTPGRSIEFAGQTYEHTFESTAIALEGPIPANTYLGSVSWGWKNDDKGKVTVLPVTLVQAGTPSDAFMAAATKWNAAVFTETGTANKFDSVDIPVTTVSSLNVAAPNMATSAIVARLATVETELKGLAAGVDKTNKEFEQRALETELAKRKVIVSVLVNNLQDAGSAAAPAEDEVFVRITGGNGVQKTPISNLKVGATKDYEIAVASLLPLGKDLVVQVVEHDRAGTASATHDDLVLDHKWASPFVPVPAIAATLNGGNYTVTLRFDK